jgi:hypothetical protein
MLLNKLLMMYFSYMLFLGNVFIRSNYNEYT